MASKYQLSDWSYLPRYSQEWVDPSTHYQNSTHLLAGTPLRPGARRSTGRWGGQVIQVRQIIVWADCQAMGLKLCSGNRHQEQSEKINGDGLPRGLLHWGPREIRRWWDPRPQLLTWRLIILNFASIIEIDSSNCLHKLLVNLQSYKIFQISI